jgi:hypothetical protein
MWNREIKMDMPPLAQVQAEQVQQIPSDAEKISVAKAVPPTAISAFLRANIEPATGGLLIYTPGSAEAVQFGGGESTKIIPISGSYIYLKALTGTSKWNIWVVGWTEQACACPQVDERTASTDDRVLPVH